MPYNPARRHRRSIRLKGYDYAQAGAYFVTVCAYQRECWFGEAGSGAVVLNDSHFPEGVLLAGVPAKVVRELTSDERVMLRESAQNYVDYVSSYRRSSR